MASCSRVVATLVSHRRRLFLSVKIAVSAFAGVAFWHRYEMADLACIVSETCEQMNSTQHHLEDRLSLLALAAAASLPMLHGMARNIAAAVVLVAWICVAAEVNFEPPHIPFVTLACAYVAFASPECDTSPVPRQGTRNAHASLLVLRLALATGYGFSGFYKARGPVWHRGHVFLLIVSQEGLRDTLPSFVFLLVSYASPVLCAFTLLVECGLPLAEAAVAIGAVPQTLLWLGWCVSAGMQCGILLLMPLTDVSVGTLVFHVALIHAAVACVIPSRREELPCVERACEEPVWEADRLGGGCMLSARPAQARRGRWNAACLVGCASAICIFSIRPVHCALAPSEASRARGRSRSLSEALLKSFLPMTITSWDDWPCTSTRKEFWRPDPNSSYVLHNVLPPARRTKPRCFMTLPAPHAQRPRARSSRQLRAQAETIHDATRHASSASRERPRTATHLTSALPHATHAQQRVQGQRTQRMSGRLARLLAEPAVAFTLARFETSHGETRVRIRGSLFRDCQSIWQFAGGGHLWHVSLSLLFNGAWGAAAEPQPGLALLLCASSPFASFRLALRVRVALGIDAEEIVRFRFGQSSWHSCDQYVRAWTSTTVQ